jgi:hypothetical protein
MAFFWFCCFVVAAFIARSKGKQLASILGKASEADRKFGEASETFKQAESLMSDARRLRREAEESVQATADQNKVYHSAIEEIINLWVNDSWKAVVDKLTASNHATQKGRMEKVFETCRKYGIEFDGRQERAFYVRLETEWKREVESEKARLEQQRIKEIMREEQQAEKMRAAELKRLDEERKDLERKHQEHLERIRILQEMEDLKKITEEQKRELDAALAENRDLEQEIAEKERRKAMAELTRAGNVYVISNIGSFGDRVFKVGMTRRLIPEDRIKELGDASVPFPFDCHMMIPSEDAPALESKLHEALWMHRLNLVNDRKEFFKAELDVIKDLVDQHCKGAPYFFASTPDASDWRESEARRKQKDFGTYHDDVEVTDESKEAA